MKRREFVCLVSVGGTVPIVVAACNSAPSTTVEGAASGDGFQSVGTLADLQANGHLLVEGTSAGQVLIALASDEAIAVNPICPHAGCVVDWQADQSTFVCPCHDSQFGPDGAVLRGPADEPLPTYDVKIEGDTVYLKVS